MFLAYKKTVIFLGSTTGSTGDIVFMLLGVFKWEKRGSSVSHEADMEFGDLLG